MRRRNLLLAGAALAATAAHAQSWPARPVRSVVPFPPGGLIDNMARLLSPRLAQELGQPLVIDNKPGAGGNLGAADAARAAPDGYTLLMASPPLTISPALYASLPYKPEQIARVGRVGRVPNVLLVNPKSGVQSVAGLLARVRQAPGRMNYASNGNGTLLHLSAELFKSTSSTFLTHIPYRGAAAAVTGLMAGEVDMMFENLPSVLGQIQGGARGNARRRDRAHQPGPGKGGKRRRNDARDGIARRRRRLHVGTGHGQLHGGRCRQMETRGRLCPHHPGITA